MVNFLGCRKLIENKKLVMKEIVIFWDAYEEYWCFLWVTML